MSTAAKYSSVYQTAQPLTERDSMLADGNIGISVASRIDYNLRFTQQAVLVVGRNAEQYSQLASQFLVSLSNVKPAVAELSHPDNHINVAFVSASSKLNDIQIRCRLIEQLFVNTLFDPEQSLAVSILRFAKQHGEAISIIIDHGHALSLQVKYELCQLVSLAKKSKLTINVVLFGLTEAVQQLAINKSLFKNKMTVIDAETGQVISLDDKKIMLKKDVSPLSLGQKISLVSAMVLIAVALIWIYLLIEEDVNQQAFSITQPTVLEKSSDHILLPSKLNDTLGNKPTRQMQKKHKIGVASDSLKLSESKVQATSEEINQALLRNIFVDPIENVPAEADDVLQALVIADNKIDSNLVRVTAKEAANQTQTQTQTAKMTDSYYQMKAEEYENGYVVQIAGFSDKKLLKRFLSLYPEENFHYYQRQLNGKSFTVITSKVFKNKVHLGSSLFRQLSMKLIPLLDNSSYNPLLIY
jgi:DamX protein